MDEKRVAYAGFEGILDNLIAMKNALDDRKEAAKEKALAEVELAFADELARIDKAIDNASYIVEPEPVVEEVAEEVAGEVNENVADTEETGEEC